MTDNTTPNQPGDGFFDRVKDAAKNVSEDFREGYEKVHDKLNAPENRDRLANFKKEFNEMTDKAVRTAQEGAEKVSEFTKDAAGKVSEKFNDLRKGDDASE